MRFIKSSNPLFNLIIPVVCYRASFRVVEPREAIRRLSTVWSYVQPIALLANVEGDCFVVSLLAMT